MICISIAQESRRLVLADMLNAAALGADLLEVRLDAFEKAPDIADLLSHKPKPVIFSCRRFQDGGKFQGSEEERLALLRQCIVSKADYVEIELDAADAVRRFPPAKRVITYTNLRETPADIADIYEQCLGKQPEAIKLVTLARTPEEAWPLIQIVARQRVPTVVVGLGKPGVMLSVLGKKIGAPWAYAALERGMETYPGQVSIGDLRGVYCYDDIGPKTRLLGLAGFGAAQTAQIGVLNAAIAALGLPARCLPIGIGSVGLFRKIIEAVKLAAVVVDTDHQEALRAVAGRLDASAEKAQAVDFLLHKEDGWIGYYTLAKASLAALEASLPPRNDTAHPLEGRMVMLVGLNPLSRALAGSLKRRGALPILAGRDKDRAHSLAQEFECRHVQYEAIYSTMHDVLIVCAEEPAPKARPGEAALHAGYLKPSMTVMDLTAALHGTTLLSEAAARGCAIIPPRNIVVQQLGIMLRLLTGKDSTIAMLSEALQRFAPEE